MIPKSHLQYLRHSFEKYVEMLLEESTYKDDSYLQFEIKTCPEVLSVLSFDPKEVELVVKELERKGYRANASEPKAYLKDPIVFARTITIYLR